MTFEEIEEIRARSIERVEAERKEENRRLRLAGIRGEMLRYAASGISATEKARRAANRRWHGHD